MRLSKEAQLLRQACKKDDVIIGVNRDRVNSIAEMRKVLAAKPYHHRPANCTRQ